MSPAADGTPADHDGGKAAPVDRDLPAGREKRAARRYPCNIPGTILMDRVHHAVRFRDVSALGCCFSGEVVVEQGDEILCVVRGISAVATVAWSDPPFGGANFHREIALPQVLRDRANRPAHHGRRLAGAMTGLPERT